MKYKFNYQGDTYTFKFDPEKDNPQTDPILQSIKNSRGLNLEGEDLENIMIRDYMPYTIARAKAGLEEFLIVTPHKIIIDWLESHSITGHVVTEVTKENVFGRHLISTQKIPVSIANWAAKVTEIRIPKNWLNNHDETIDGLTMEQIEQYGLWISTYIGSHWICETFSEGNPIDINPTKCEVVIF